VEARKERPIIFSGEMVKAILDGRKTQTRRPIKPQPELDVCRGWWWKGKCYGIIASLYGNKLPVAKLAQDMRTACPYQIGDILWVKETWRVVSEGNYCVEGKTVRILHIEYKSGWDGKRYSQKTFQFVLPDDKDKLCNYKVGEWRSPIFMPRWASRIKLEVTDIWVERVQEISSEDIHKEGIDRWEDYQNGKHISVYQARGRFKALWDSLWAKKGFGWNVNPWVWAIAFRRIENESQD